jgi:hypothetical protein
VRTEVTINDPVTQCEVCALEADWAVTATLAQSPHSPAARNRTGLCAPIPVSTAGQRWTRVAMLGNAGTSQHV